MPARRTNVKGSSELALSTLISNLPPASVFSTRMTADPEIQSDSKPGRRRLKSTFVWIGCGLLVVMLLAFCSWRDKRSQAKEGLVWLTPADVAIFQKPGKLTSLKFRILSFSPRIWNWYARHKQQLQLAIAFEGFPTNAAPPLPMPTAAHCYTNSDGMRAWIVSAEEWPRGQKPIDKFTVAGMHMTTLEGMEATIASGSTTSPTATVSVSPRVKGRHFDVVVRATYTTPSLTNSVSSAPSQLTNFAVICRAALPNGGALVVDSGKSADSSGTNYWFIVSPIAVDSKGNPKKL